MKAIGIILGILIVFIIVCIPPAYKELYGRNMAWIYFILSIIQSSIALYIFVKFYTWFFSKLK